MKRFTGFTLIEILVALAVISILIALGVPGFSNLIQDNRMVTHTNNLVGSLILARTEAVKRSVQMTVCSSSSGTNCTVSNWDQGWIVFTDTGTSDTVDGSDTILRVTGALGGGTIITATARTLSYSPSGMLANCEDCGWEPNAPASGLLAALNRAGSHAAGMLMSVLPISEALASGFAAGGTFTLCDHNRSAEIGRNIEIISTGRVRTSKVVCD